MRVVTVTANAAVDTLHVLDRLECGAINRVVRTVAVPGGKGNNVARVLAALGHAVVATGFVGGRSGAFIEAGLRECGIEPRFVPVDGDSRVCLTLLEPATGTITEVREPGFAIPPEAADRLLDVVVAAAREADAVVVSGSLPPGLPSDSYATLLGALRPLPAFLALDAGGEALRLGLAGRPDLIAPNAAEMAGLMGRDAEPGAIGLEEMIAFARRELIGALLPAETRVVLTLGRRGAALVSRHGAFLATPPAVAAVNPVGSGDALLAGYLDARWRGGDPADCSAKRPAERPAGRDEAAIAAAVAVGTAAALRETIGEVRPEDVARIRRGVRVDRVASRPRPRGDGAFERGRERRVSRTYDEIRNQPRAWEETIPAATDQWRRIAPSLDLGPNSHALFVGSGTSLYIAQSAAHAFQEATGRVASAVPASEVFLSADSTVPKHGSVVAFLISRSGTTSEGVLAADFLARSRGNVRTVGLTCHPGTELAATTHHVVELPHAAERSVVMTQSFTSMLLALQLIAAEVAADDRLRGELARLPDLLRAGLADAEAFGRELGERADLQRFVFLGLGPNAGLAEEGRLKLKEMTQLSCAAYNPLEFRHGPISTLAADTAVLLLAGTRERAYLPDVVADLQRAGAYVATVGPDLTPPADRALRLADDLSDLARGVLYLPPLQFLGYHRAVALGLHPDEPRNLNQVVTIRAR